MLIETDRNGKIKPVLVMSMTELTVLDPKTDFNTGAQKEEFGRPVWKGTGLKVLRYEQIVNEEGKPVRTKMIGEEPNVSLALTEQPTKEIEFGKKYVLEGQIKINHYISGAGDNARLGVTITAERIKEIG